MTDELERRLRSADPAPAPRQGEPAAPWIRDLVEATMTITKEQNGTRTDLRRRPPARWLAVAACGAAAIALSGGLYASMQGPAPRTAQPPAPVPAVQLALPDPAQAAAGICLVFSVQTLRDMPVAFSGTVTGVDGGTVRMTVDRWYRGGRSQEVVLKASAAADVALVGAVTFEQGKRYLVSAGEGVVSSCGYTGEWDPRYEASFREAFGG
jgi:hypothetical protein